MSKCGWLRRCRYEPRFNTVESGPVLTPQQIKAIGSNAFTDDVPQIIKSMRDRTATYIGDICIRCGQPALNPQKVQPSEALPRPERQESGQ